MFVTCCFWLALVGIVNTQENDDLANLRKDQEILKKIVLELKKSNDNLHQKFMTMEEDLMEWKELVRQLKNENGYLKKEMTNMEQDLNDRMIKLENENIFLKSQCKIEALARNNRTLCGNEASPVVHQEKSNVDKKFKSNVKRQVIGKCLCFFSVIFRWKFEWQIKGKLEIVRPKSPGVRGFVVCLPVRLLFKSI